MSGQGARDQDVSGRGDEQEGSWSGDGVGGRRKEMTLYEKATYATQPADILYKFYFLDVTDDIQELWGKTKDRWNDVEVTTSRAQANRFLLPGLSRWFPAMIACLSSPCPRRRPQTYGRWR